MYQLLIVDDEPLVQAGIRSMLNWNEYRDLWNCHERSGGAEDY